MKRRNTLAGLYRYPKSLATEHSLSRMRASAAQSAPNYNGRQLWMDPYDLSTLSLRNTTKLASASSQYLSRTTGGVDSGNPFNFQNTNGASQTIFGFSFWVRFESFTAGQQPLAGKHEIADANLNNGSWMIRPGGTSNLTNLNCVFWTTATSSGLQQKNCTGSPLPFVAGRKYHVCGWYDGSQAGDDTLVLHVYVNNTKLTTPVGTGLPAQFRNPTGAASVLEIGRNFNANYSNMEIEDFGLWALPAAWTATDVANLWNGGFGHTWATLPTQYKTTTPPTAYWSLDEDGGPYVDRVNGYNLTGSGTPTRMQRVVSWTDKNAGLVFASQSRVGNTSVWQPARYIEPAYLPNGFASGKPCVRFTKASASSTLDASWLICPVNDWCEFGTGSIFSNTLYPNTIAFETFDIATGNDTLDASVDDNKLYYMLGVANTSAPTDPANDSMQVRIRDVALSLNGNIDCYTATAGTLASGSINIAPTKKYAREYSVLGTSGVNLTTQGDHVMYVSEDGGAYAQQTLYGRSTAYAGFVNLVSQRTYIALGGGPARYNANSDAAWGPPTNGANGSGVDMGDVVVFGGVVAAPQREAMRAWLLTR